MQLLILDLNFSYVIKCDQRALNFLACATIDGRRVKIKGKSILECSLQLDPVSVG